MKNLLDEARRSTFTRWHALSRAALPAALLAVLLANAGHAAAQSSVTVFGVMDVNVKYVKTGDVNVKQVSTDGLTPSRIGFRGSEDLGGGLRAGFWLESGIAGDTGSQFSPTKFWNRRATVSLSSGTLGEVRMGRDYTPTFWNQALYDPFQLNGVGSAFNLPALAPTYSILGSGVLNAVRADNSVGYHLPQNLGGVYGQLMITAPEGTQVSKYRGGRLGYKAGKFDASFAFSRAGTLTTDDLTLAVFGASYDFGVAQLMGTAMRAAYASKRQINLMLGVIVPLGVTELRATVQRADASGAGTDANDATQLALGVTYYLSKNTALYSNVGRIANHGAASFTVNTPPPAPAAGRVSQGVEAGLRILF